MSTLSNAWVQALAHELDEAERSRQAIEHFSKRYPGMTIEDGYRINRAWVQMKLERGRRVIGHKIGLTSRAMQISSQINEPDYGTLLDDMLYVAQEGQLLEIPLDRFIAPRVEVELAFVLKSPLQGPHVGVPEVLAATDYITPAIEIIDARIEQFDRHTKAMRRVFDTISDNAANAAIVLGQAKSAAHAHPTSSANAAPAQMYRADPKNCDRAWCGAILRLNGVVEETGLAAGVRGDPAIGVAWLANKLAPWGECLQAGEVVLAGSFTRPVAAQRNDCFEADYGPLGVLRWTFV